MFGYLTSLDVDHGRLDEKEPNDQAANFGKRKRRSFLSTHKGSNGSALDSDVACDTVSSVRFLYKLFSMASVMDLPPLSPTSVSDITKPLQRGGLRTQVSQRLAIAIFARHFKAGEKLTVQPLAELFGVSRTPVREALMELESLGMVEVLPHKGALVREFGPHEARDLIQFRKILEREAVRCACGKIPQDQLERLRRELKQVSSDPPSAASNQATRELDLRLHATIASYCQNRRLQEEIARCWTICKAMADAYYILLRASDRFVRMEENLEHLAIVEALLAGNSDASQRALEAHLDTFLEDYVQNHFPQDSAS